MDTRRSAVVTSTRSDPTTDTRGGPPSPRSGGVDHATGPVHSAGGVPGTTPDLATAVLYTDEDQVEWRAQGAIRLDADQVTWRCSTSRSWGILGRTLVGFDDGVVRDLGPWTTTQIASDRALGTVTTQRVITGPDIERGVLPQDEAFPDDLVRMGSSENEVGALVRWTVDGAPRVYALTPGASS